MQSSLVRKLDYCHQFLHFDLIHVELLIDVVDVILSDSGIDEKFLGITLFALVPNTTEFMNAISFALNGNIALRCVRTDLLYLYSGYLWRIQYGNWIGVRTPGLLTADPCYGRLLGVV